MHRQPHHATAQGFGYKTPTTAVAGESAVCELAAAAMDQLPTSAST